MLHSVTVKITLSLGLLILPVNYTIYDGINPFLPLFQPYQMAKRWAVSRSLIQVDICFVLVNHHSLLFGTFWKEQSWRLIPDTQTELALWNFHRTDTHYLLGRGMLI